jgi:hypothetical protein
MRPSRQASYTSSSLRACLDVYLLDTAHIARLCPHFFVLFCRGLWWRCSTLMKTRAGSFWPPFLRFFYFLTIFLLGSKVAALLDVHGGAGWEFLELLISAPAAASSATRFDSSSLKLPQRSLYSLNSQSAAERRGCVHPKRSCIPACCGIYASSPAPVGRRSHCCGHKRKSLHTYMPIAVVC